MPAACGGFSALDVGLSAQVLLCHLIPSHDARFWNAPEWLAWRPH